MASIWVAGRQNGAGEQQCESAVLGCVAGYRAELRDLASTPLLTRSYQRIDVDHLQRSTTDKTLRAEIKRAVARARRRTSDRALPKFTSERDGQRRIVEDPPLLTRINYAEADQLARGLDEYLATLAPHWRRALGGYTLIDIAHKVVGVGSVGLRAYVALLEGSSPDDVLFLQLKQARRSVLARHVHGESAWHAHQGQRVVEYQQALQTVSDPLLGWTTVAGRQYYVRQFRNMKGSVALDSIDGAAPPTAWMSPWPASPGGTPTRPRRITPPWSRQPTAVPSRSSAAYDRQPGQSEPGQASRVFSSRRITLPVDVLGRSGTNRTERGRL